MSSRENRTMRFITQRLGLITGCAIAGALAGRIYYSNVDAPVHLPERITPSPNAYDSYLKAFPKLRDIHGSTTIDQRQKLPPLAERQAALAENAEGLQLARFALTQQYLAPRQNNIEVNRSWAKFRALARQFSDEGEVRFETGDKTGAINSYIDAIQVGIQMPNGGSIIELLVGFACEAIGRKQIWKRIDQWDSQSLKLGTQKMEELMKKKVPLSDIFTNEKSEAQISLPQLFNDPKSVWELTHTDQIADSEDNQPSLPADWVLRVNQQMFLFRYPKRSIISRYNAYMDQIIELYKKPYALRDTLPTLPNDLISTTLIPVFSQAGWKDDVDQAQMRLLTVTLALRAYKSDHGAFPANLDTLITEKYLVQVPVDPFSSNGAIPMRYRFDNEKSYVYSIGPDGVDNDGQEIINLREANGDAINQDSPQRYHVRLESKGDIVAGLNLY